VRLPFRHPAAYGVTYGLVDTIVKSDVSKWPQVRIAVLVSMQVTYISTGRVRQNLIADKEAAATLITTTPLRKTKESSHAIDLNRGGQPFRWRHELVQDLSSAFVDFSPAKIPSALSF
jgi:hypothetical protein